VDNISFIGDLMIIFQTVITVLKRDGINPESAVTMEDFMGTKDDD
jgi:lipopolysaccharide/colanic/teichoic acid biosynthesis glycosyltransferase